MAFNYILVPSLLAHRKTVQHNHRIQQTASAATSLRLGGPTRASFVYKQMGRLAPAQRLAQGCTVHAVPRTVQRHGTVALRQQLYTTR